LLLVRYTTVDKMKLSLLSYFLLFVVSGLKNMVATSPSVIVVGAGPAGIAAATKLLENSITNITILEAGNRIGGRINSVRLGDGFVDVGAEYCHGQEENVVYELVKDLDLLQHSKPCTPEYLKLYYSNGSTIEEEMTMNLAKLIQNYDDEINQTCGLSLGDAFLPVYNSTILKKYENDKQKLKVATEALKYTNDLILLHEGAFSWLRPSAGRHYRACKGDQGMTWKKGGYHTILDVLMKSYPDPSQKLPIDDKIFFDKKVTKIIWNNDDDEVIVKTFDNSSLTAHHVIFTPSIGVLKEQKDSLFHPQLPERKENAMEAMGFDAIVKIILHFPQRWWGDDDVDFLFVWSKEDLLNTIHEFPDGPSQHGVSWVAQIVALVEVPSNRNVRIALFSGDLVPKIEQTPEELVKRGCMYVIRKFLGRDYNVTDADKIIRSQWYTNPNFRGTYSYEKHGYFKREVSYQAQLAEPLLDDEDIPRVLFAGEATHPTVYSTVHGAIESGRREAERIINLHKK
jgi:spermine oxidase